MGPMNLGVDPNPDAPSSSNVFLMLNYCSTKIYMALGLHAPPERTLSSHGHIVDTSVLQSCHVLPKAGLVTA